MGYFDVMFKGSTPRITVAEARAKQQAGVKLIDVRELIEWNKGHIVDALHIPMAKLMKEAAAFSHSEELMVVCQSGQRSLYAAQRLIDAGYNAVSVHGGTTAWKAAGYPIA